MATELNFVEKKMKEIFGSESWVPDRQVCEVHWRLKARDYESLRLANKAKEDYNP